MAAGFAASLLNFATTQGASRDVLLRASGLTEAEVASLDGRIAMGAYRALVGAAMAETRDPALMLRHAASTGLDKVSVVGLIVQSAGGLRRSLEQLNRFGRLIADLDPSTGGDRYVLRFEGAALWLIDYLPDANLAPTAIEDTFTRMICDIRRLHPERVFALEVELSYPEPAHRAVYDEIWQVPIRFNAARNAIRIDPIWAEDTAPPENPYVFGLFAGHGESLLDHLRQTTTIVGQIEARLLPSLHQGTPSADDIARDMGMSRQTLYRRLRDEGATFSGVHDALRQRLALDYLTARKATIHETAYLLGFAEASSFVRAFRRWTGQTPSEFRAALG